MFPSTASKTSDDADVHVVSTKNNPKTISKVNRVPILSARIITMTPSSLFFLVLSDLASSENIRLTMRLRRLLIYLFAHWMHLELARHYSGVTFLYILISNKSEYIIT